MLHFIKSPLINANEDTATLLHWNCTAGQFVQRGEIICTMETTKSTFEIQAENAGYLHPLVSAGEQVHVDQPLAVITDTQDETILPPSDTAETAREKGNDLPPTWTQKARLIAQKHNLQPSEIEKILPETVNRITEEIVLNYIEESQTVDRNKVILQPHSPLNNHAIQRILILGGGNIAVLVLDILARIPNQQAVGILDDNPSTHGTKIMECPILGSLEVCLQLWEQNMFDFAALAIGQLPVRGNIFQRFTHAGIPFANIIDPTASILAGARMGSGNMIMGFCRIGPECEIGDNNFLSAYINLEHHNRLGDHCTFGPAVFTSGGVIIGSQVRFGTGVFIEPRLTIGDNSTIASGVVLTTNVPPNSIVKSKTNFTIQPK